MPATSHAAHPAPPGAARPLLAVNNVAPRYASCGYILENGRIVLDGDASTLRRNEDVKDFCLGPGSGSGRSFRDIKS